MINKPTDPVSWKTVAEDFRNADLLVGNGFSRSIIDRFDASSLFDVFVASLEDEAKPFWRGFDSHDFELIQEKLLSAAEVNSKFKVECEKIVAGIETLKGGLLSAVRTAHPDFSAIPKEALQRAASTLTPFQQIFSLSYDLLLYHVAMRAKDNQLPFDDFFGSPDGTEYLRFQPGGERRHSRSIHFLHGSLMIFHHRGVGTMKLRRSRTNELIQAIRAKIQDGVFPVFVSGGTAVEKKRSIEENPYLKYVFSRFEKSANSLVVFGCSLSNADLHIVNAIQASRRRLAIGIRAKDDEETEQKIFRYHQMFAKQKPIYFLADSFCERAA